MYSYIGFLHIKSLTIYKFDYPFPITTSKSNFIFNCLLHGNVNSTPEQHLKSGCKLCNTIKKPHKTSLELLLKFKTIHKDTYEYIELPTYANVKIKIKCKKHGVFLLAPSKHLLGFGCKFCSYENQKGGWKNSDWFRTSQSSKDFVSFSVYIIHCYNESENFIKIGRTFTTVDKRFEGKSKLPYCYEIIKLINFNDDFLQCCNYENSLKSLFNLFKYRPILKFKGHTECFNMDILSLISTD